LKQLNKIIIQPKILLLIFFAVAILILSSALTELSQSKSELFGLMEKQSHSLLESILVASQNALLANEKIESEITNRLLNNAILIRTLYYQKRLTPKLLENITEQNKIYRINIFNRYGKKILSSHKQIHFNLDETNSPSKLLEPIFKNKTDTLIIGVKEARYEEGKRFVVALATKNNGAIVLNVDGKELLDFRKKIGFGVLLKQISTNPEIIYLALQDSTGLLAAAGNIIDLDLTYSSSIITKAIKDSSFEWHISDSDSLKVFEAVHPFEYKNKIIGIFRLGLSLEPLYHINDRIIRRVITIGIILLIFGSALLSLVFIRQNYNLLQKQYKTIETYSNKIIKSVADGILVLDHGNTIKLFNDAVLKLFDINKKGLIGKELTSLFDDKDCRDLLNSESQVIQTDCKIRGNQKNFLVSKAEFIDEDTNRNLILVIRDLTEWKKLENQVQRKERLAAMGELASGVAHEIRNPLNTIGTIVQQLHKDFEPVDNKEEYLDLSKLVYSEVKRINKTINNFLKFARPELIVASNFNLTEFINRLKKQYKPMMDEKNIKMEISHGYQGEVYWDKNQIQQVMMNLIQNSIDAIKKEGEIKITTEKINDDIIISVSDNGEGIAKDKINKIFNLYYTTKAKGTGIGLSLVQKIIYEHGGLVNLESEKNAGTKIMIKLPKRYKDIQ